MRGVTSCSAVQPSWQIVVDVGRIVNRIVKLNVYANGRCTDPFIRHMQKLPLGGDGGGDKRISVLVYANSAHR